MDQVQSDELSPLEVELTHACERSRSHNESVTVEVEDLAQAYITLFDLYSMLAIDRGDELDGAWDVWAVDPYTDDMVFRLKLRRPRG